MKIAVIQPKMVGDVLITSVIFEELRLKFPTAELHYIINSNADEVVKNNPFVNELILLYPNKQKGIIGFLKQLKRIRKEKYDVIIDSYSKLKTGLFCKFSGAKTTISFHKSYSHYFYSDTIDRNKASISIATKAVEHRLQLLQPLGIDFRVLKPKIYLTTDEIERANQILLQEGILLNKPIVMISALGSSISKTYPLKYMAKIVDEIAKFKNVQILFNYMPSQKEDAIKLYSLCEPATQNQIFINFYAKSLLDFMSVCSQCTSLIGNEGGATNMAKALDIPTFTIFSPFILKNDWNMFENSTTNISVHISDYISESISKKSNTFEALYLKLKPQLFIDKLNAFLNHNNH
ncbi:MAG: glycosyltransferase family 9 protein [Flavobacterium sp.]|nr:glycosyltransferase family 9 protein [Flavobacterium sp.]